MDTSIVKTIELPNDVKLSGYVGEYCLDRIEQTHNFYEYDLLKKWFTKENYKVIYDIGANIGNHTVYFGKNAPEAHIYSFEPFPLNYEMLKKNVIENHLESHVELFNVALGDVQGTVFMNINQESNLGSVSVKSVSDNSYDGKKDATQTLIKVELTTVDSLGLPEPDFIKIDVEGFEPEVLKGMEKTLKKVQNVAVWIEVADNNADVVYDLMKDMGYGVADFYLAASNNILWLKGEGACLSNKDFFIRLILENELKLLLHDARMKYRDTTERHTIALSKINQQHTDAINNITRRHFDELNKMKNENIVLVNKLSEATAGLGKSISLLSALSEEQEQLRKEQEQLRKEFDQYKQKISRFKNTWYGKLALLGYRILKRTKQLIHYIIKKG